MKFDMDVIKSMLIKNQPEILMGIGIGGMIFSTIWGIKATFKTSKTIESLEKDLARKPTRKEIFKKIWPYYIPVIVSGIFSTTSIILGNRVSAKRNAALVAAYAMAETAYHEYRDQTLKVVGDKKEQEIREKVSEKRVADSHSTNDIFLTGDGDCLFFEPLSGRYFRSNWNKILKAANELNARSISSMSGSTSLTDWFEELGLERTRTSDYICWEIADGRNGTIDISLTATLTPDDVPCGAIDYRSLPKPF